MKKPFLIKSVIACGFFAFSLLFFLAQQHPKIYNASLGKISCNYERTNNGNGSIIQGQQPYQHITHNNLYNWDAVLYKSIRDNMYSPFCHGHQVMQAFYPLFPIIWKISMIDSSLIIIFNYFLLVLALILLSGYLNGNTKEDYFIYAIALLLPTTAMYYLPYAEALFLLTFAIAVIGLLKRNYWLFFIGAMAFSMTRPACLIYIIALLATDIRYLINHKNFIYFIKEITLKIIPFISGFLMVTFIQYLYTGSWTAYWESLTYWPTRQGFNYPIVDWSVEGFGMNVIAVCFVALPALIYAIVWGIKAFNRSDTPPPSLFSGDKNWVKEYIFNSSIVFIAGNFIYTILTSGNVLNGFARYSMAIPFFYIVWFLLPEKLKAVSTISKMVGIGLSMAGLILFLYFVEYGGSRFQFAMSGLYLSLAVLLFFIAAPSLSFRSKLIVFLILVGPCIVWHTYLFNMYLCQAWVYT